MVASSLVELLPVWGWVLVGIGLYWLVVLGLREAGALPEYVNNQGPILLLHTRRFKALIERAARPKRVWRAWGNFGIGVSLVLMVGLFLLLVVGAYNQLRDPMPATAANQPRNILVIPGVNDFLPLSATPEIVLGLLVGLVVHEGGHAVMCRVGDIDIESMGLALLAVLPIGAFVEPDEDSRRAADRGDQTRMFASGVMNNFAVAIVAHALLFVLIASSIGVASGAAVGGVLPGSAADAAGIEMGDRIVAVDDRPVTTNDDLDDTLADIDDRQVAVDVDDGESVRTVAVNRSLLVVGVTQGTPFDDIETGERIETVDGVAVDTEADFEAALDDRREATIRTAGGTEVTGPIGAAVVVTEDGPAARDGVPTGPGVVTELDGERTVSADAMQDVLAGTEPGQAVAVEVYVDGEPEVHEVTLGEHSDGHGMLGVQVAPGVSGLSVNDFGARLYPAEQYLGLLGGGEVFGSFWSQVTVVHLVPFGTLAGLPYNFAGFTGDVANFFVVEGPLGSLGGVAFGVANALFWIGWINLILGYFNLIPAFPLDGGHILRTSTEAIVARLPLDARQELTRAITTSVGLAMLASLVLMFFGPQLLR